MIPKLTARNRVFAAASKGGGGGGGGGGKSGGGSKRKGGSNAANKVSATGFGPPVKRVNSKNAASHAQQQLFFLSSPITVELQDELTTTEMAETPRWDTFCNHLEGEWVGQYGAYTPWEAKPEPVWQDEKRKYLDWVYSRCIEYPGQLDNGSEEDPEGEGAASSSGEGENEKGEGVSRGHVEATSSNRKSQREIALTGGIDQVLFRRLTRAVSVEQLSKLELEPLDGSALTAEQEEGSSGGDNVDVEALSNNTNGVVFFNGGSYSAGPDFIGPPNYKILQDLGPSTEEEELDAPTDRSGIDQDVGAGTEDSATCSGRGARDREEGSEEGEGGEGGMMTAPGSISIFESCLVDWASKSRMRLKVTVRINHDSDNGEVDLEVLRVLLFREFWVGPVGSSAGNVQATIADSGIEKVPCTELPRASRDSLHGSWAVFTTSALAVEDSNPFTGEPSVTWVYMTNEDRQLWQVPRGPPSEEDDSGVALWLPGGVVVSLRMVDFTAQEDEGNSAGEEGAASTQNAGSATDAYEVDPQEAAVQQPESGSSKDINDGEGSSKAVRGFNFGFHWCLPSGSGTGSSLQVCSVDRDYDGAGVLRGVRSSTAVKGGWSGGKM